MRLARIVYDNGAGSVFMPKLATNCSQLHVLINLDDTLGSTALVVDKDTGELVENTTYLANGATESDYRPDRWKSLREDYRFTGKEEDVEVGLQYFGKRFLSPYLGRWVSADPLGVHVPEEADWNLYAYVHGNVLQAVDPVGLKDAAVRQAAIVAGNNSADARLAGLSKYQQNKLGEGRTVVLEKPSAASFGTAAHKAAAIAGPGGTLKLSGGHGIQASDAAARGQAEFSLGPGGLRVSRATLDPGIAAKDKKVLDAYAHSPEAGAMAERNEGVSVSDARERNDTRQALLSLRDAVQQNGLRKIEIAACGVGNDTKLMKSVAKFMGPNVRVEGYSRDIEPAPDSKTGEISKLKSGNSEVKGPDVGVQSSSKNDSLANDIAANVQYTNQTQSEEK